jgi:hypothetical protein
MGFMLDTSGGQASKIVASDHPAGTHVAGPSIMIDSNDARDPSPERQELPEGRETPVMGPRRSRRKVRRMQGEPAIDRPYDPEMDKGRGDDNPWQDPGGPEPANG